MNAGIIWFLIGIFFLSILIIYKKQSQKSKPKITKEKDLVDYVIKEAKSKKIKKEEIKNFFLENREILMLTFVASTGLPMLINNMEKVLEELEKNY